MEESEVCAVCGKTNREANLINAVLDRENEIVKMCENCAFIEKAVVIPKPSKIQLQDSKIPYTVYERLVRMSGIKPNNPKQLKKAKTENVTLNSLQEIAMQKQKEKEMQSKQDINLINTGSEKRAEIDFSSKNVKVGDLVKLKRKIFG